MKEQFGKVNTHARAHAAVGRRAARDEEPARRRRGLNDSGISVSKLLLNPLFFLEATGEVYQGNSGRFRRTSAAT